MAAFDRAVQLGYRHLETDVRATADGVAVAFHDHLLDRVTNHTGRIGSLGWAQIKPARIMGSEPIPRLDEVLDAFPQVHINLDVKAHAAIGPTLDALRRTNSWHRVRLAAFSHRRLHALRQAAGPSVATAMSPMEVLTMKARRARLPAALSRHPLPVAAQVPAAAGWLPVVTAPFVETAHRLSVEVHVWTVNSRPDMQRLLDLGVDAIITDRADLLRDVLQDRGAWPS